MHEVFCRARQIQAEEEEEKEEEEEAARGGEIPYETALKRIITT